MFVSFVTTWACARGDPLRGSYAEFCNDFKSCGRLCNSLVISGLDSRLENCSFVTDWVFEDWFVTTIPPFYSSVWGRGETVLKWCSPARLPSTSRMLLVGGGQLMSRERGEVCRLSFDSGGGLGPLAWSCDRFDSLHWSEMRRAHPSLESGWARK